jgi:hypothetical protein
MGKRHAGVVLIAVVALTGCYKTVGPVITSVRLDKNGGLHYTRCNLVVSQTWTIGDDDFENCVNESGDTMQAPDPLSTKSKAKPAPDQ